MGQSVDRCDVVILGGGPAGSSTALSLRRHEPSLSVVLVEKTRYADRRIGETLPPMAKVFLDHLHVWDAFQAQGHREVFGTTAAWGEPAIRENPYVFLMRGTGWHLDRVRFDDMLAVEAEARGVRVVRGSRLDRAGAEGRAWRLRLSNGQELWTRFVVDATGRRAVFARGRGGSLAIRDRLVGFVRFFTEPAGRDPSTLVEAVAEGWWYTAGLPGGLRVVACMTDLDLGRRLRLRDETAWSHQLASTIHVSRRVGDALPNGPMLIRPAESRCLEPAAGENWLAVGDAASIFDPLSSQGIVKALQAGIFASYAIADLLVKGDSSGIARYRRLVRDEFENYWQTRARYYQEERRWPESEFWQRKRGRLDEIVPGR